MKLNYKEFGEGPPMIILHGLLGSLDNWQTLAKRFSEHFRVYTVDQRNHGQSPHSEEMNYDVMVDDLLELMVDLNIVQPILIGHSMGGKTVMHFALQHPDKLSSLIVADMSPRIYPIHHHEILEALAEVDFNSLRSRKEIEEFLFGKLKNMAVVYFLTKNIYWVEKHKLGFRFNLDVLRRNLEIISDWSDEGLMFSGKTLFIRAGKANYIQESEPSILEHFPNAEVVTIDAGHWVHAEKADEFYEEVTNFLAH